MKYFLKQKFFAAGDDFEVFDESGKLLYYFDGKVWAIGSKTIVIDSQTGKEIARIRRKLFAIRPTFVITSSGTRLAKIFKKALSIKKTFVIDVPGPDDITVVGELLEHNYHFYKNNSEIATVCKKWFRGEDSYSIEIKNNFEALLVLSCVVVIDLVCHPGRDSGFKTSKG